MKHGRTYYTVRTIVRGIFWTTLTIALAVTLWAVLVAVAIIEQEGWN